MPEKGRGGWKRAFERTKPLPRSERSIGAQGFAAMFKYGFYPEQGAEPVVVAAIDDESVEFGR